jgi:hypothetical protein
MTIELRVLVEASLQLKTLPYQPLLRSLTMQKNELLFTIPANTTLSPRTSSLKSVLPELDSLDEWMQLILVMLFENQRPSSPWREYLSSSRE